MDLSNISLLSLQTKYMQRDVVVQALCEVLEPYFQKLSDDVRLVYIYGRIDELKEDIVDELAWQFHVDFYENSLPIDKKRMLVKNSLRWHKIKGTPAAVEEVSNTIFGYSYVDEWFNYDGNPYMFKVVTDITVISKGLKDFYRVIDSVKNTRSHLEGVVGEVANKIVITTDHNIHHVKQPLCNTFKCGRWPTSSTKGKTYKNNINVNSNKSNFNNKYKMVNTFKAGE